MRLPTTAHRTRSLTGVLEVITTPPVDLPATGPWDPTHPTADGLAWLVDQSRRGGARSLTLVAHPTTAALEGLVGETGFACRREMLQLRRELPAPPPPEGTEVRPFVAATDAESWLEVNRRAFAWHPDQGRWNAEDLTRRLDEPWFDPDGFLVHDSPDHDGIDAFCWTKVHAPTADEPALGEIFVIAVDPRSHRRGLGRAMVLAGLDHLARGGLDHAMLYVEADNAAGRRLYDTLGFRVHELHRWYELSLPAT